MKKEFIVLSISEFHPAQAAIMIDGEAVAAAHEERFSRLKEDMGFPCKAAEYCMDAAGVKPEDIDVVAMVGESFDADGIVDILFKRAALYSIKDWIQEQKKYWIPKLAENKRIKTAFKLMGGQDRIPEHYYDLVDFNVEGAPKKTASAFNNIRKNAVQKHLGIPKGRVVFMPYNRCNLYHAYYSSRFRGDDVAVISADGNCGSSGSEVAHVTDQGLQIISGSESSFQSGLYQWASLHLGMRPYHHELKVMELAPFTTEYERQRSLDRLKPILSVDAENPALLFNENPLNFYHYLRDKLEGARFDGIAGGLQHLVESRLVEMTGAVMEKTQKRRICFSGGLAQNARINMALANLDPVEDFFVPLAPGDDSIVLGAAYWLTEKEFLEQGRNPDSIPFLRSAYMGKESPIEEIDEAVRNINMEEEFSFYEEVQPDLVSGLLAKGWTVAVCRGRSEFSRCALGARSIFSHPSMQGVINKLNRQIRYNDFWMPVNPVITENAASKYLENPKGVSSDYMNIAFNVKADAREKLSNALHQGDGAVKPQILRAGTNPWLDQILDHFEKRTGAAALLNKPFRLHGEPLVNSPEDALNDFIRSDLDALMLDDLLITRLEILD